VRLGVVVDTSVLYPALTGGDGDPYAEAGRRLLETVRLVVVPSIVVHELVWSIRRSLGREAAQALVETLIHRGNVHVEPVRLEDIDAALENVKLYHDLLVVAAAERLGLPLATFDREMAKLARRRGVELLDWSLIQPLHAPRSRAVRT